MSVDASVAGFALLFETAFGKSSSCVIPISAVIISTGVNLALAVDAVTGKCKKPKQKEEPKQDEIPNKGETCSL